jgi:Uma2 family endonuclease
MADRATPTIDSGHPEDLASSPAEPLLEAGDRLSRDEFERRYERMPQLKKAELVEGVVYMPSPVRARRHAKPHNDLGVWLGTYASETPGVECFDNSSVRLDLDNEPQPDLVLRKLPEKGGQARISADDYIEGAPELAVEIAGSARAYDLHQKKGAYRRNGVLEYLAWITGEQRLVWWRLREGSYQEISPSSGGVLKSRIFPGLWLEPGALLKADMKAVLKTLRRGLGSPEHRAFVKQ